MNKKVYWTIAFIVCAGAMFISWQIAICLLIIFFGYAWDKWPDDNGPD